MLKSLYAKWWHNNLNVKQKVKFISYSKCTKFLALSSTQHIQVGNVNEAWSDTKKKSKFQSVKKLNNNNNNIIIKNNKFAWDGCSDMMSAVTWTWELYIYFICIS